MKTSLDFLIAARRSEAAELLALSDTASLVDATARLVHGLQRERGLGNLYLGSAGQRFAAQRQAQIEETDRLQAALLARFDRFDTGVTPSGHWARLFARIAYAMQGLASLATLRSLVLRGAYSPERSTSAYCRIVSGLLAVVFEAADTATDAEVSRLLVGLFCFMQYKEQAGQERAAGSFMFAIGRIDPAQRERLRQLVEAQDKSLEAFQSFVDPSLLAAWRDREGCARHDAFRRMRSVLNRTADGGILNVAHSGRWFDACTARIDAMRMFEEEMTEALRTLCERRRGIVVSELSALEVLGPEPADRAALSDPMDFLDERRTARGARETPALGPLLGASVLELVEAQTDRLQAMTAELDAVRTSLNERKLIERAKGLLMARRGIDEAAAHALLQHAAMQGRQRLVDVATGVLDCRGNTAAV